MAADPGGSRARSAPIVVPELRDYQQINAELIRLLNRGQAHVRLEGVEGQRLLVFGLAGAWHALVEVCGNPGPELAAELDAPGLTVVCRGSAADGPGRGLRAGRLLILGAAGTAIGYTQSGGLIVCAGPVGPRAGLGQRGGRLVLLDRCAHLAGERQSGGRLFLDPALAGPNLRRGARGGELVSIDRASPGSLPASPDDRVTLDEAIELVARLG